MVATTKTFLDNFDEVVESWKKLKTIRQTQDQARKAIEAVTLRKAEDVLCRVKGLPETNGWEVLQAVTNYLTYDFKGSQGMVATKQEKALAVIEGRA